MPGPDGDRGTQLDVDVDAIRYTPAEDTILEAFAALTGQTNRSEGVHKTSHSQELRYLQ